MTGLACRFGEQRRPQPLLQRRRRIFRRAPAFERVATRLLLSANIAGLARSAAELFEPVVIGLKLIITDGPILNRHVSRQCVLTVAFFEMAAQLKVRRQKAPGLSVPVDPGPADAIAWKEA